MHDLETSEIVLEDGGLRAAVCLLGAELRSLKTGAVEWMWGGDPAIWPGVSPILFPVIGKSPDGHVSIEGQRHAMPIHGIAKDKTFTVRDRQADRCELVLTRSALTQATYPFDFELSLHYRLEAGEIHARLAVRNLGERPMPFCAGFHPGFRQPEGSDSSIIVQLVGEDAPPVWRLDPNGLLVASDEPSCFEQGRLVVEDRAFKQSAIILRDQTARQVWYGPQGGAGVRVRSKNLAYLAFWKRPEAKYLCIEPWSGLPPQAGTGDDLATRPGALMLEPGARWSAEIAITPGVPAPE